MRSTELNSLKEYYNKKIYLSIIFTYDQENQKKCAHFLSEKNNLNDFKTLVEYFAEHKLLDDFCKRNIFDILNILRYDICQNNVEVINTINSIYNKVNVQVYDCSINFYRDEYLKRYVKVEPELDELVNSKVEDIRESILLDPLIITTHLFIDDSSFDKYINDLALNKNYLNSINAIVKDNPFLVENKSFLNRFKTVVIKQSKLTDSILFKLKTKIFINRLNKLQKEI